MNTKWFAIMSTHTGLTNHTTDPPEGATCNIKGCCAVAQVRMIIAPSRFDADGVDHSQDPSTFDTCEWHWPAMRASCLSSGHRIVDATGDTGELAAGFPQCSIFSSDAGRLYASARIGRSPQRATVHAWLVGQLRTQLERASACYG